MLLSSRRRALVLVAHPDDETLWAGGTMMLHPQWDWHVVSLCRGEDPDRRPKFFAAMTHLAAQGTMYSLDDGPQQRRSDQQIQEAVVLTLRNENYDLIITHSPFGEYTRHLRHEEIGRAVLHLWRVNKLSLKELWLFAYSDDGKSHYPRACGDADVVVQLTNVIWERKLAVIREIYGFAPDSWEAMCTPCKEAFWCFDNVCSAEAWQRQHASRPRLGAARYAIERRDGDEGPGSV